MMNLFLDDERFPPDDGREWVIVRNASQAINVLSEHSVTYLSLDHDLGDETLNGNGYQVACWIEERTAIDSLYVPPTLTVHSQNPVGARRMQQVIDGIAKLVRAREK